MSSPANAALGDVLVEARPGFACGDDAADGVFQFRMNNITTEGQLDLSKKRRVPRNSRNIDRYLVEPGDVLFNATNSPDLVGKTAYFPGLEEPAVFSNHFLRLRPDADRLDGRFLSRWLNVQFQRGRFKGICRQWVNQATVNRDALLAMQIRLPPLPEQRRIAEILDKADALRAKRRAALSQLDVLTQSIFLDMFGDPATNPKGWPISRVGAVAKQIRGVTYSKGEASKEAKAGFLPILRAGNIAAGDIVMDDLVFVPAERVAEEQLLRNNDVLIATSSGSLDVVGKAARVQDNMPVGFGAFCKVLRPGSEVDSTFFAAFFSTQYYRRRVSELAAGININNLRNEHLDNFQLPKPPRALQRSFAAIVAATIACRASNRGSLSLLNALFASLQHRAFRGEL